jgi:hypothetical protein
VDSLTPASPLAGIEREKIVRGRGPMVLTQQLMAGQAPTSPASGPALIELVAVCS